MLWKSQMVDVQVKQTTPVTVLPAVDGRVPVYHPVALVAHRYISGANVAIRVASPPKRTQMTIHICKAQPEISKLVKRNHSSCRFWTILQWRRIKRNITTRIHNDTICCETTWICVKCIVWTLCGQIHSCYKQSIFYSILKFNMFTWSRSWCWRSWTKKQIS